MVLRLFHSGLSPLWPMRRRAVGQFAVAALYRCRMLRNQDGRVTHRAGFDRRCKRFKLTHHSRRGVLPDRVLVEIEICLWPG